MQRFELKNSFGWTFFVLIVASFWSAAVKFDASPSSAPAVANRSISDDSLTTDASTAQTFEAESVAFSRDVPEPTAAFFETSSLGVRRAQDSTRRRLVGDDFSSSTVSSRSPFSARARSSAAFRSFWACQSASRPLFLTLRSLRN